MHWLPQLLVPAGSWQGSSSAGPWTLVTTVVTPAFDWSMFERRSISSPAALAGRHPANRRTYPAATSAVSRPHPSISRRESGSACFNSSERCSAGIGPAPFNARSHKARTSPGLPP